MQVVVPLQGSAPDPGLLVVVRFHCVQHLLQRLPAEWAGTSPSGPLLEAAKAEAVKAEDHVSYVFSVAQADRTLAVCCCLRWPSVEQLACAGPCSTAGLLQGFLSSPCHVLPREMCEVPDLVWC